MHIIFQAEKPLLYCITHRGESSRIMLLSVNCSVAVVVMYLMEREFSGWCSFNNLQLFSAGNAVNGPLLLVVGKSLTLNDKKEVLMFMLWVGWYTDTANLPTTWTSTATCESFLGTKQQLLFSHLVVQPNHFVTHPVINPVSCASHLSYSLSK